MSKKKDDTCLWNVVLRAGVGDVVGTILGSIVAEPAGAVVCAKIGAWISDLLNRLRWWLLPGTLTPPRHRAVPNCHPRHAALFSPHE